MSSTSNNPTRWQGRFAGLALTGLMALSSLAIAQLPRSQRLGLSALTVAVSLGMVIGNTLFPAMAARTAEGVDLSKTTLLRLGVILYGLRITFQEIASIGWAGVLIDVLMVGITFWLAVQLGTRVFGLDRRFSMLIGAGSAICGAAAVMAVEPVVRGEPHKVTAAVATVVVFGTLGMFLYPVLYPHLHLSEEAFGIFTGSTIQEVAQVVAAARSVSDSAATMAVIEKLLRVMMLAPFLMLLSGMERHRSRDTPHLGGVAIPIPWFAVLFIVASVVRSLDVLPSAVVKALMQVDSLVLSMAMVALGLRTQVAAFRTAGVKPLLLAGILFCFLVCGGYAINRLIAHLYHFAG